MNRTDATLAVDGTTYQGRLNEPEGPVKGGVLVVPGAGHGPYGDVFDRFAEAAAERGYVVARFVTWEDRSDIGEKTHADFRAEMHAGVEFLRGRDCEAVTVVAKSFGGRLALRHAPAVADRLVLWAPAIKFGAHDEFPSIDADELANVAVPTRILQGDEDEVVSLDNAADLAEHLPSGDLVELTGEDHSFRTDQRRIVRETADFLAD
ncbi:alpha/beta hydrolase [Haloarchaeobius amylolyticus]|uniref:alpha/beta hydrolase n=1 Tax=Haloarchaeobius amylolyticus TaxID=1198296 RepID=UPI0022707F84|nr:alpha/beta fold hydrolase [Haloarchaeobius amylolyticus]